jgi:hypothetical protein
MTAGDRPGCDEGVAFRDDVDAGTLDRRGRPHGRAGGRGNDDEGVVDRRGRRGLGTTVLATNKHGERGEDEKRQPGQAPAVYHGAYRERRQRRSATDCSGQT